MSRIDGGYRFYGVGILVKAKVFFFYFWGLSYLIVSILWEVYGSFF